MSRTHTGYTKLLTALRKSATNPVINELAKAKQKSLMAPTIRQANTPTKPSQEQSGLQKDQQYVRDWFKYMQEMRNYGKDNE